MSRHGREGKKRKSRGLGFDDNGDDLSIAAMDSFEDFNLALIARIQRARHNSNLVDDYAPRACTD